MGHGVPHEHALQEDFSTSTRYRRIYEVSTYGVWFLVNVCHRNLHGF